MAMKNTVISESAYQNINILEKYSAKYTHITDFIFQTGSSLLSVDGCPPFRPILSALPTPTDKLAKFLVLILEALTTNKYTVKD